MAGWYYISGDKRLEQDAWGRGRLSNLLLRGNSANDTVWRPGEREIAASEVQGLFPAPPSSPDEPPPFPPPSTTGN